MPRDAVSRTANVERTGLSESDQKVRFTPLVNLCCVLSEQKVRLIPFISEHIML